MIWKTPSGLAFAASVSSSLSRGKNAVVMLPRPLPVESLVRTVSRDLKNAGCRAPKLFDLSRAEGAGAGGEGPEGLVPILRDAWDWEDEGRRPDFGARPSLPELFKALEEDGSLKFLALTGLEALPLRSQAAIAAGASEWAGLSQDASSPSPRGLRLALVVSPSFREMRSEPFLTRHAFWGLIRQSDLEWAFRRRMASSRAQDSMSQAEYLYMRPMCLALCSEDFELMSRIVSARPKSLEEVEELLKSHPLRKTAERLGWPQDAGAAADRHPLLSGGLPPRKPTSKRDVELWAEGLLTAGGFSRLHPALLGKEGLERAVASAQREVFLPAVDHVQSLLVSTVEMAYGPDVWEANLREGDSLTHVLTEISPMAYFITQTLRATPRFQYPAKKSAQDCAFSWRQLRHAGAHNKVATFREVLSAVEKYNEFREHYERMVRLKGSAPAPHCINGRGRATGAAR
ncbi:MAG: hypothetical protein LBQ12_09300 [Deltaproteobacteria bacterium]|nr:hypothetical protein [Deltaproteobacteria bacterium]